MKLFKAQIIAMAFVENLGKTVIDCLYDNKGIQVWAPGDISSKPAVFVGVVLNEVGDTFLAKKDSKNTHEIPDPKDASKKIVVPLFKAGDTVKRLAISYEFKGLSGVSEQDNLIATAKDLNYTTPLQFVLGGTSKHQSAVAE